MTSITDEQIKQELSKLIPQLTAIGVNYLKVRVGNGNYWMMSYGPPEEDVWNKPPSGGTLIKSELGNGWWVWTY